MPCPANGVCDQDGKLNCNPTFLRQGESCVRDSRVMRKAGQMAAILEEWLAELKGEAECFGGKRDGILGESEALRLLGELFLPSGVAAAKQGKPYEDFLGVYEAMKAETLTPVRVHKVGGVFYADRAKRPWRCLLMRALDAVKWYLIGCVLVPTLLTLMIRLVRRNRLWWQLRRDCLVRAIEAGTTVTPNVGGPSTADLQRALQYEGLPMTEAQLAEKLRVLVSGRIFKGDIQKGEDMRRGGAFFWSKFAAQQLRAGGQVNPGAHAGVLPARRFPL